MKVFISYVRADWEIAHRLYTDLKRVGFDPWLDTENLLAGQDWRHLIPQLLKKADFVLVLLSSHSVSKRGFVQKEIRLALDLLDEFPPSEIFLIPVYLEDCEPAHARLQDIHWVKLFPSYEDGLSRILRTLSSQKDHETPDSRNSVTKSSEHRENQQTKPILFTSGNTNLNTVRLVAFAMKEQLIRDQNPPLQKIVLFASPQTRTSELYTQQMTIYEEILGAEVSLERVSVGDDGLAKIEDFTRVFREPGEKYVDLTNGQKTTTAQLYLAASLLKIDHIFSISLIVNPGHFPEQPVRGEHYNYIHIPPFAHLTNLSRLSYFDFIFYMEELDTSFCDIHSQSSLAHIKTDLRQAIIDFFQQSSSKSAITNATTCVDLFISTLHHFLQDYQFARDFSANHEIYLDKQKDVLGAITFFFKLYAEQTANHSEWWRRDDNLEAILTIPGLLSSLRTFRILAVHSGSSSHRFQSNEIRICLNLALECFRCARTSELFWERLKLR